MGFIAEIFSSIFGGKTSMVFSQQDKQVIADSAQRMADIVTESLSIARTTHNSSTRESRIKSARETMLKLRAMEAKYPFLKLSQFLDVEREIAELEKASSPSTAAESVQMHNNRMGALLENKDNNAIKGLVYHATLQLRTPLKVLLMDGERLNEGVPPTADEAWHGIWLPEIKSWKEIGIDLEEIPESKESSDIGLVKHDEYLPFLIDIRKAIESGGSIQDKIGRLKDVLRIKQYAKFVRAHQGHGPIIDNFFPPVVSTIDGLNGTVISALLESKITNVKKLRKKTDKELLAIKGVGPVALKSIRVFVENYRGDDTAERTDGVTQ
jgi:hypothetical protein